MPPTPCFVLHRNAVGIAEKGEDGKEIGGITYLPSKRCRISNLDGSELALDGSKRGTAHLLNNAATNPALPRPSVPAAKVSGHMAFIGSANSEGEPGRVAIVKDSAA